jgi:hypothetical protein
MAGRSRSKNGVAEFTLALAEGKTRGLAYVPAIHVFAARVTRVTPVRPHRTARGRRQNDKGARGIPARKRGDLGFSFYASAARA